MELNQAPSNYIGKNHPDFSTNKQQDAFKYLTYILDIIYMKRLNIVDSNCILID